MDENTSLQTIMCPTDQHTVKLTAVTGLKDRYMYMTVTGSFADSSSNPIETVVKGATSLLPRRMAVSMMLRSSSARLHSLTWPGYMGVVKFTLLPVEWLVSRRRCRS